VNRRRMLHALRAEVGEYEDAAVLPEETDPQLYLSRNRQPQPFHLICSADNVLSQLSGEVNVHLRDSSVRWFRMSVGDHVYIPAGTPHRIVPVAEGVMLRYQPLDAGRQGVAWYCDGCDSEVQRYEWEHSADTPAVSVYAAACARFSASAEARTCGKCGAVAAPVDLAAFGWVAASLSARTPLTSARTRGHYRS
jgi:hypothetical protein